MPADQRQKQCTERNTEADGQLLQHPAQAGGPAQIAVGHFRIGEGVGCHELAGAGKAEDENQARMIQCGVLGLISAKPSERE